MLAAVLTVIAAQERQHQPATAMSLIPLTRNEIRRRFAKLVTSTIQPISHRLHWSL